MEHHSSVRCSNVPHATILVDAPKPPKKRYLASSASQLAQQHHQPPSLDDSTQSSLSLSTVTIDQSSTTNQKNKNRTTVSGANNNNNSYYHRHKHQQTTITPKSVDCAVSILDPLIFDQDTLERIIEHALSDKTNLTDKTESSSNRQYHHHQQQQTLSLFNKTSHLFDQQATLTAAPTHHYSIQCSSEPESSLLLDHHSHSKHLDNFANATASPSKTDQPTRQQTTANGITRNYLDNCKSSLFEWDLENDLKLKQEKASAQQKNNDMAIDGEQEKPMDFSVNKTYEQTGQNIINHLIDKMMAQSNDSSIVMLLA